MFHCAEFSGDVKLIALPISVEILSHHWRQRGQGKGSKNLLLKVAKSNIVLLSWPNLQQWRGLVVGVGIWPCRIFFFFFSTQGAEWNISILPVWGKIVYHSVFYQYTCKQNVNQEECCDPRCQIEHFESRNIYIHVLVNHQGKTYYAESFRPKVSRWIFCLFRGRIY